MWRGHRGEGEVMLVVVGGGVRDVEGKVERRGNWQPSSLTRISDPYPMSWEGPFIFDGIFDTVVSSVSHHFCCAQQRWLVRYLCAPYSLYQALATCSLYLGDC